MEVLKVFLTSLLSLAVMFIICKINGQRQLSQMTMFDYINSITVGSIAAELSTNLEQWQRPLTAMLIYGALTLLFNVLTCKCITLRRFCVGRPLLLMENGKLDRKALSRAHIDLNEFLAECRTAGYFDLNQLQAVILEPSGKFSFLCCPGFRPATPEDFSLHPETEPLWYSLVVDGKLLEKNLRSSGRDIQWLNEQLRQNGISGVQDTLIALCDTDGRFFACGASDAPSPKDIFE